MHASFWSCVRSSSKAMFGFLLICVPLLVGQNTTAPIEANKELPDAPTPVKAASPAPSNLDFTHRTLSPGFGASGNQNSFRMGTLPAIEHPTFTTNAPGSKEIRPGGTKVGGRSPAKLFSFDPIGGHTNRAVTRTPEWYTSHIPLAGSIVRQGLKISKAHPHLTTVIKTLKPQL